MAIISSSFILRSLSLFHVTAGYYLLTNPSMLSMQNLVLVLSAAMQLPDPSPSSIASRFAPSSAPDCLSSPNPASALCGLFLALLGIGDMTATGLKEFAFDEYWSAQAPIRMAVWLSVGLYVYVFGRGKEDIGFVSNVGKESGGVGGELQNGLVFTLAFFETMTMFWVHMTLREERSKAVEQFAEDQRRKGHRA